jgi:hypothetical protein
MNSGHDRASKESATLCDELYHRLKDSASTLLREEKGKPCVFYELEITELLIHTTQAIVYWFLFEAMPKTTVHLLCLAYTCETESRQKGGQRSSLFLLLSVTKLTFCHLSI